MTSVKIGGNHQSVGWGIDRAPFSENLGKTHGQKGSDRGYRLAARAGTDPLGLQPLSEPRLRHRDLQDKVRATHGQRGADCGYRLALESNIISTVAMGRKSRRAMLGSSWKPYFL